MPNRMPKSLALIFLVVAAICARLGLWQLARLRERRAANAVAQTKRALAPLILERQPALSDTGLAGRRVVVVGRFDYDRELIVRGQVMDGVPGIHVVTPLRFEGSDTALLVNRGFVPTPDAATPPPDTAHDRGTVRIDGIALPIGLARGGQPLQHNGRTTWGRLDLAAVRQALPYPIAGVEVRRTPDTAGPEARSFPRALPAPSLDDGPHLNYALQWFAFTALALVFAGIVWWKRG